MNPIIVTYANKYDFPLLQQSTIEFGWALKAIVEPGEYKGANYKFKRILKEIPRLKEQGYTHLISLDAFDTVVNGSSVQFEETWKRLGSPWLLQAAETNLYPPEIYGLREQFPATGTRYKFVNSPFVLDLSAVDTEFFYEFSKIGDQDDQVHLSKFYLEWRKHLEYYFDKDQRVIQTLFNVPLNHFTKSGKHWYNSETGTMPLFFHGNGKVPMDWMKKKVWSNKMTTTPRVAIGLRTGEMARRADFYDTLQQLVKPEGTTIICPHGPSPARNANLIIKTALAQGATHIFFMDDDTVPRNMDIIPKLLEHDKDIVGGLYVMRNSPHRPCLFQSSNDKGECAHFFLSKGLQGLHKVRNMGLGCVLIKTDVFRAMQANPELPDNPEIWVRLGGAEPDHWCDDIVFFNRAVALDYELYCDFDQTAGHQAQVTLWPERTADGNWMTIYDTNGTHRFGIPAPTHHPADPNFQGINDIPGAK